MKQTTLHLTICTWIELENYHKNDQQFNRHHFCAFQVHIV